MGGNAEFRDGPIVNRESRPRRQEELFDPIWRGWDQPREEDRLVGPIYCLVNRRGGDVVHMSSFLERCRGYEIDRRGALRERPLPDLETVPPEVRFFEDWQQTSARSQRVFAHWALDIRDYSVEGEREIGFIPRPLRQPRLRATRDVSVHALLERCDVIDREVDLPFGWFFLMIQGHWVDQGVGLAIAQALKAQHVRLPDRDTAVLLRWSDRPYGF